jgi:hypothetical protein
LEYLKGKDLSEYLDMDGIRMDLRKVVWEVVDWMHLAQDRDKWLAVLNTVINLQLP